MWYVCVFPFANLAKDCLAGTCAERFRHELLRPALLEPDTVFWRPCFERNVLRSLQGMTPLWALLFLASPPCVASRESCLAFPWRCCNDNGIPLPCRGFFLYERLVTSPLKSKITVANAAEPLPGNACRVYGIYVPRTVIRSALSIMGCEGLFYACSLLK